MTKNSSYIFGLHAVQSVLHNHPERILRLLVMQGRRDEKVAGLIKKVEHLSIDIEFVTREQLDQYSQFGTHQGIAAFCLQPPTFSENELWALLDNLSETPFLLILDGVQDPHNLGACFRSAEAAGVHAVIAPKDKSVGITPIVSKVASGAAETVPFIQVTNLARTLLALKMRGIWLYGATEDAETTLYQADLRGAIAIVLGAEGRGLRRLTKEHCDALVKIPMYGKVASLNVSVATGVFLFEIVRQRAFS